ncbi:hypothetical protein HK102_001890 [Quaeritorhiza haematococci]|nr:hypothetical protein HK102_001890 [Quaeritorhiza haematococci]
MKLKLSCLLYGDHPDRAFIIEIDSNAYIAQLKDLVAHRLADRLSTSSPTTSVASYTKYVDSIILFRVDESLKPEDPRLAGVSPTDSGSEGVLCKAVKCTKLAAPLRPVGQFFDAPSNSRPTSVGSAAGVGVEEVSDDLRVLAVYVKPGLFDTLPPPYASFPVRMEKDYVENVGSGVSGTAVDEYAAPQPQSGDVVNESSGAAPERTPEQTEQLRAIANDVRNIQQTLGPLPNTFTAIASYSPSQPDELLVAAGDVVLVQSVQEDSWLVGSNLSRNANINGVFPAVCVAVPSGGQSWTKEMVAANAVVAPESGNLSPTYIDESRFSYVPSEVGSGTSSLFVPNDWTSLISGQQSSAGSSQPLVENQIYQQPTYAQRPISFPPMVQISPVAVQVQKPFDPSYQYGQQQNDPPQNVAPNPLPANPARAENNNNNNNEPANSLPNPSPAGGKTDPNKTWFSKRRNRIIVVLIIVAAVVAGVGYGIYRVVGSGGVGIGGGGVGLNSSTPAGQLLRRFTYPATASTIKTQHVFAVPDTDTVAAVGNDGSLQVFSISSGNNVASATRTGELYTLSGYSSGPAGTFLYDAGAGGQITESRVVDETLQTGRIFTANNPANPVVSSLDVDKDGKYLVAAIMTANTTAVWDLSVGSTTPRLLTGNTNWIRSVAFSIDLNSVFSVGRDPRVYIHTLRGTSNTPLRILDGGLHKAEVWSVTVSAELNRVWSGDASGNVVEWNLADGSGRILLAKGKNISPHAGSVVAMYVVPGTKRLYTGDSLGLIVEWDLDAGTTTDAVFERGAGSAVNDISVVAKTKKMYVARDGALVEEYSIS